jgi:hypothetical protein
VILHRSSDRDALITALRQGRTPDWLRALIERAQDAGIRRCRWSMLLGPRFADLRAELDAELRSRERRRSQYRTEPVPDLPVRPPPPPRSPP